MGRPMTNVLMLIAAVIIAYQFGCRVGRIEGTAEVAKECKLLGKFYYGEEVFECTHISGSNGNEF